MKKDREVICTIINKMLDNPHPNGVYQINATCAELESYIKYIRAETIGYMYGTACMMLDNNKDIRLAEATNIYHDAVYGLTGERV